VALSGFIGAVIGAIAVLAAVFLASYLQRRHDLKRQFKEQLFDIYSDLDHFRSNHFHIVKWDEDTDTHKDPRGLHGYCDDDHPNYKVAVQRFKAKRYAILDRLRKIKFVEVWRYKLDEDLSARIIRCLFGYSYATEVERQKELVSCVDELRREWLTIDSQFEEIAEDNHRLREADPDEYVRRFRIVEGPDEEVY
jgi:hypothetical protein